VYSDSHTKTVDNICKYHELQCEATDALLAHTITEGSDNNEKEIPKQHWQADLSAFQDINNNNYERPTKHQRHISFNYRRSEIFQTDRGTEVSIQEREEKLNENIPYYTASYNNMQYYLAMIANIHSMMQNILRLALRNSETKSGNNFQDNFCPYDYQAMLYCLAYQQKIQHLGLAEHIQQISETRYQDYTGPEQTEPLDLSQKKTVFKNEIIQQTKTLLTREAIKRNQFGCKVSNKENHKSINKSQNEATGIQQNLNPLKYNISKQIIEYNWNKKKNIQRRRFKLRRCQQNNTKQKTPVIQQQKKEEVIILDDPGEKKKVKRKMMGKPINIRESKRTKISETRLPFTVDTGIHELEKQIGSKTSKKLVKDGEDSINVSLANIALEDGLKVLLYQEGVYYPGIVSAVAPPDIYGVRIVKRRGNKPVILAREQLISQAVLDKKPASVSDLELGSHVCAVWSTKFSCLYPGTVVMVTNNNLVTVMFDDGDCRDCHISDIRFLPDENYCHGLSVARQDLVTGISTAHQGRIGEQSSRNKIPKHVESRKIFSKLNISSEILPKNAWAWSDEGYKQSKRSRKVYHDIIEKDGETVVVGDAVLLHSSDSGDGKPYIGRVDRMWETGTGKKKVLIRWLYHADQVEGVVQGGGRVEQIKTKGALFESNHCDENFVCSIYKTCNILSLAEVRQSQENNEDLSELYYLAGVYQPVQGNIILNNGVLE